MADPATQWTIDQVWAALRQAQARAEQERAALIANRQRVNALWSRFQNVTGPPLPGAEASLRSLNARQQRLEEFYQALGRKVGAVSQQIQNFMRQHGINPSGLAGLGQVPVLLVAGGIIAALMLVGKGLDWLHGAINTQTKAIGLNEKVLGMISRREVTPEQGLEMMRVTQHEADQAIATDPFGLTGLAKQLVPLAVIVIGGILAMTVLPKLLAAAQPRRTPRRRSYA